MYVIEESDEKELLFVQEFPYFYQFITKEVRMLEFAADLSLSYKDEKSCKDLNREAEEISNAIHVLTNRYTMDLFE